MKLITNSVPLLHDNYFDFSTEKELQIKLAMLVSFCRQVCLGMVYLSGKGFIHRDLAARNILLSSDKVCKASCKNEKLLKAILRLGIL